MKRMQNAAGHLLRAIGNTILLTALVPAVMVLGVAMPFLLRRPAR